MKTLKSTTIILLLFFLIVGCSSDDSTSRTESFKIKAVSITATDFPSTEGDALELYGRISTQLAYDDVTEEHILWQRNRDSFVEAGRRKDVLINSEGSEYTFTLTEEQFQNGSFSFYTQMFDRDPDGNDDYLGNELGSAAVKEFMSLPDDDNPNYFSFRLVEFNGVDVRVRFSVEHIR